VTDPVKGPEALRKAKKMREYHMDERKTEALRRIMLKLLDEKVIVPIPFDMAK
jgi:hypothetical protein